MPNWFGRKLPKELEDLEPEEVAKRLKEAEEMKTKLGEAETKVNELNTKFETFSNDFEAKLTTAVTEAVTKATKPASSNNNKDGNNDNNRTAADFLTEPDRAFAERAAPLAGLALNTAGYVAKEAARNKMQREQRLNPGKKFDGYFFEKYENEIDELAKTVSAQQLANPVTWEHIFYNVKGRHADEIAAQFRDGKLEIGIESGSTGNHGNNNNQGDETKLTPQELKIAEKMGRTPEEYLKFKKTISSGLGVNV